MAVLSLTDLLHLGEVTAALGIVLSFYVAPSVVHGKPALPGQLREIMLILSLQSSQPPSFYQDAMHLLLHIYMDFGMHVIMLTK